MVHARVATAGRAHGGRLLRHATHWLGMTQHRPGEWPELKQKKQRREWLHASIVAPPRQRDKHRGTSPQPEVAFRKASSKSCEPPKPV